MKELKSVTLMIYNLIFTSINNICMITLSVRWNLLLFQMARFKHWSPSYVTEGLCLGHCYVIGFSVLTHKVSVQLLVNVEAYWGPTGTYIIADYRPTYSINQRLFWLHVSTKRRVTTVMIMSTFIIHFTEYGILLGDDTDIL